LDPQAGLYLKTPWSHDGTESEGPGDLSPQVPAHRHRRGRCKGDQDPDLASDAGML